MLTSVWKRLAFRSYFFNNKACDFGDFGVGTVFETGQTANLQGALKFEPQSVYCFSPDIAPGPPRSRRGATLEPRQSLAARSLEPQTLASQTLESRQPVKIKVLEAKFCSWGPEWTCYDSVVDNAKC